jgi:hypothetical protein
VSEPFVIIAQYSSPVEARLARAQLEAEGIPIFVDNEPSDPMVVGLQMIRICVPEDRVEQARAVLGAAASAIAGEPRVEVTQQHCPICGTGQITEERGSPLTRIALLLLGQFVPLPEGSGGRRRLRCEVCAYRWREGDDAEGRVPTIG